MAIKTGDIFKSLTFDGVDIRDYGVYITGEAVFNAPTRDVNMITIPGRNGLYAQDNGRFENRTVSYPAGLFSGTEAGFQADIEALRDLLCSKVGYCRLEDEYNPDEYMLAVYKSGLEVSPTQLKAGEFDLVFECKPQRFLKSGEARTALNPPTTLTNPTPYPAAPILESSGSGTFTLTHNGASSVIEIEAQTLGEITIGEPTTVTRNTGQTFTATATIDGSQAATNDWLQLWNLVVEYPRAATNVTCDSVTITTQRQDITATATGTSFIFQFPVYLMQKGLAYSDSVTATLNYTVNGSSQSRSVTISFAYDGNSTYTVTGTTIQGGLKFKVAFDKTTAFSSKTLSPIYIDCETGLCWGEASGTLMSANANVKLPAELPRLGKGQTTITYSGLSNVYIIPRWWRV